MQDHLDPIAVPTEGLVDSVIDDLPEAVHEAATVGGSDVHPGPLTHGLKPLEHLEMVRGVLAGRLAGRRLLRCWTGHAARLVCGTDVRSRRHGLGSQVTIRGVRSRSEASGHDLGMTRFTCWPNPTGEALDVLDCCIRAPVRRPTAQTP